MAVYVKDEYVIKSEPQTFRQSFNFYRCHSTSTHQQAGGKIEREILVFFLYTVSFDSNLR